MSYKVLPRRGPEEGLKTLKGEENELVFTIDTKKLFICVNGKWESVCEKPEIAEHICNNLIYIVKRNKS